MINILIYCLIIFLFPLPAYAYLDPGFGSLLLQAIIGFFALLFGYISLYWYKTKSFIIKILKNFKSKYMRK
jgi:hypothetical protein